jgi:ribosomal protein L23
MYRHYALREILTQLQGDDFFVREGQQAEVEERLGRKTTLYITLTKQDAASEERILGIIDEVQEQVNLIGRYIQNAPTEEAKRNSRNLAAHAAIRDIVFVVSETSTKQQIKSILEKYKNPTTNDQRTRENLQTRFRRVVGVVSTEEFSSKTKRQYALLSKKLLGITEKDLRKTLMTNDEMIALMIGDVLVTSQTTRDSERGKQIIRLAKTMNKPSVVFDRIFYEVPSEDNPQKKVRESRWGFSYYSLPFLRPQAKFNISGRVKSKSNNAEEARNFQRDLSIKTLMVLEDYKLQVGNSRLYLDYILRQRDRIEQETWKALAATVYGARKEGGDILTMLLNPGIYDVLRHDVTPISENDLQSHLDNPTLVVGILPNTRMPGNRPTLRPVTHR